MTTQFIVQVGNVFAFFFFVKDNLGFNEIDKFYFDILKKKRDPSEIRTEIVFLTNSVKKFIFFFQK
jgi:hypothetical protein